jgi:hypothetical protein
MPGWRTDKIFMQRNGPGRQSLTGHSATGFVATLCGRICSCGSQNGYTAWLCRPDH